MFSSELSLFTKKFLIAIAILCVVFFAYYLRAEIGVIVTSLFFVALFHPVITYLEKKKIPSAFGIILVFLVILLVLSIGIGSAVPLIIEWFKSLLGELRNIRFEEIFSYLPKYIQDTISSIDTSSVFSAISGQKDTIIAAIQNIFSGGSGLFLGITSSATTFSLVTVFTFFFTIERRKIGNFILSFLPKEWKKRIESNRNAIFEAFLSWIRGQALLSLSIFLMTLIGLSILQFFGIGVPHIFALSLVAGIAECIPYVGPIIALIPALALSLSDGGVVIFSILSLYIIIQQTENNFLVPYLVGRSLSLSPSYVLLATFLGFAIFGVLGVLVALPIAAVIQILFFPKKTGK